MLSMGLNAPFYLLGAYSLDISTVIRKLTQRGGSAIATEEHLFCTRGGSARVASIKEASLGS